ncbi:MAG TPA: flagellar hook-associated protein FlgL [Solirubrobacteraceae bacterium]|jgi:flagellar hook-associated protein 3 FlgL|nr:flagellar hook-associated protein FlgL [Solirubrobacteraceae bacterium]
MSERITQAMTSSSTLNDINAAFTKMERSAAEMSSGKTILQPSDNPYGASRAIDLQSQLDGLESYERAAQDGIAWTQAATSGMANIGEVMQHVRVLVLQASNGTLSSGDLKNIGTEISQLTETIKQDANIQYAGQYVFAGTATTTPPYTQGANDEYNGDEGTVARSVNPGSSLAINTKLSSVLGEGTASKDGKLLDTLRTIVTHLEEGTPEAKAALNSTDLAGIDSNFEALTQLEATTGSTTNQLQVALTRIESLGSSVTKALSNTENADFAKVSIDYSNERAAYEAALRAGASIVQESLMNFLK